MNGRFASLRRGGDLSFLQVFVILTPSTWLVGEVGKKLAVLRKKRENHWPTLPCNRSLCQVLYDTHDEKFDSKFLQFTLLVVGLVTRLRDDLHLVVGRQYTPKCQHADSSIVT